MLVVVLRLSNRKEQKYLRRCWNVAKSTTKSCKILLVVEIVIVECEYVISLNSCMCIFRYMYISQKQPFAGPLFILFSSLLLILFVLLFDLHGLLPNHMDWKLRCEHVMWSHDMAMWPVREISWNTTKMKRKRITRIMNMDKMDTKYRKREIYFCAI